MKRAAPDGDFEDWRPKGDGKGKGKGKKGDNGKKGRAASASNMRRETPDGKAICYAYNTKGSRCKLKAKCRFAHVCARCGVAKCPMYECTCPAASSN
jgi:hypothetical protein